VSGQLHTVASSLGVKEPEWSTNRKETNLLQSVRDTRDVQVGDSVTDTGYSDVAGEVL
jgi:hypothetical protein